MLSGHLPAVTLPGHLLAVDGPGDRPREAGGAGHQPAPHLPLLGPLGVSGVQSLGQEQHLQQLGAPPASPGCEAPPHVVCVTLLVVVDLLPAPLLQPGLTRVPLVVGAELRDDLPAHRLLPHSAHITAVLTAALTAATHQTKEAQPDLQIARLALSAKMVQRLTPNDREIIAYKWPALTDRLQSL